MPEKGLHARTFQNAFRTHIAHVRVCAHVCVCECVRTCACANLISQLTVCYLVLLYEQLPACLQFHVLDICPFLSVVESYNRTMVVGVEIINVC